MAEQRTNQPASRGPGGGPGRHGYQKPKDLRGTLGKLMHYLGRYKSLLALVVVLLVISSACTVGGSYLIKPLINDYILTGDFPGLAKMLAFMAAVYIVGAACSFGYARIMVHVSQNTVAKIRSDLFDRMQSLPLKFFDTHTHGELMSRYTNDIDTISEALNNSFGSLISCSLNFVGTEPCADGDHLCHAGGDAAGGEGHRRPQPPVLRPAAVCTGYCERLYRGDDRGPEGHQGFQP